MNNYQKILLGFRIGDAINGRWIIFPGNDYTGITDNSSKTYA